MTQVKKGKKAITDLRNREPTQKEEAKEPWRRPDTGWTKLNVDASFSAEQNSGTWGAILRDDTGNVIISAWGLIDKCLSAEIAEALACLEGVKAILPVVAKPVHLESDCAGVMLELNSKERSKSQISQIVSEVKQLLQGVPIFVSARLIGQPIMLLIC
jgi:hypothetical protein